MPYIIYANLECLVKKIDGCANDPEKYSSSKIGEHIPSGYSTSTIWEFDHIKTNILYTVEKIAWKSFVIV